MTSLKISFECWSMRSKNDEKELDCIYKEKEVKIMYRYFLCPPHLHSCLGLRA